MHIHPDELVATWQLVRVLLSIERLKVTGIEATAMPLRPSVTCASISIAEPDSISGGMVMLAKMGLGRHSTVTFVTAVWYRLFVAVRLTR
jgi:hypothetical protein